MTRENAIFFGIGAVTGGAVTALFFLIKEGIMFVGEGSNTYYDETSTDTDEDSDSEEPPVSFKDTPVVDESVRIAYNEILKNSGYHAENGQHDDVCICSEEEYFDGANSGVFDLVTLTLYSDGVLANTITDMVLSYGDVASILGSYTVGEIKRRFDANEDVLYFRNMRLHTQYEIYYDTRTYEEVTGAVAYG